MAEQGTSYQRIARESLIDAQAALMQMSERWAEQWAQQLDIMVASLSPPPLSIEEEESDVSVDLVGAAGTDAAVGEPESPRDAAVGAGADDSLVVEQVGGDVPPIQLYQFEPVVLARVQLRVDVVARSAVDAQQKFADRDWLFYTIPNDSVEDVVEYPPATIVKVSDGEHVKSWWLEQNGYADPCVECGAMLLLDEQRCPYCGVSQASISDEELADAGSR